MILRVALAFGLALLGVALRLQWVGGGLPVLEPVAYEVASTARAFAADGRSVAGVGSPGEVGLLALAFAAGGATDGLLIGVSAFLFAATVAAALWLGEGAFGVRPGLAAALLVGTFPSLVAGGSSGRAQAAGLALLVTFGLVAGAPRHPAWAGLALAAAILAEPGLVVLAPVVILFAVWPRGSAPGDARPRPLRDLARLLLGAGGVLGTAAAAGLLRLWPGPPGAAGLAHEASALFLSSSVEVRALWVVALLFPLAILTSPEGVDAARRLRQLALLGVIGAMAAKAWGIGGSPVTALVPVLLVLVAEWIVRAFAAGPRPALALAAGLAGLAALAPVGPENTAEKRRLFRKLGRFVARESPVGAFVLVDPALRLPAPGLTWYSDRAARGLSPATLAAGRMRAPAFVLVTASSRPQMAQELGPAPEVVARWWGSEWDEPVFLLRLR